MPERSRGPLRVAFAPSEVAYNPYLRNLAAALPRDRIEPIGYHWDDLAGAGAVRHVDVVHIHWVQMLLDIARDDPPSRRALRHLRRLLRLRQLTTSVVWTMHNHRSHEAASPTLDGLVRRATAATARVSIVHCEQARRELMRLWPVARCRVIAHPAAVTPPRDRQALRRRLGVDPGTRLIVIPGAVRPYKDVAGALRALRAARDPALVVLVVGWPLNEAIAGEVRSAAAGDPRFRLRLEHADEEELRTMVGAADVALLPYRRALTSGSAVLCLEEGTPVVAPDLGCLREQVGDAGATYRPEDVGDGVRQALSLPLGELARLRDRARARARSMTWERAGALHAEVYEEAAGIAGRPRRPTTPDPPQVC